MKNDKENFIRIQEKINVLFMGKNDTLEALMINFTKNTVFPRQIDRFPLLENLRMQNTDLKKLEFNGKSNITSLFLGDNQISEIDHNAFNGLLNLKLLYLNNNELKQIHNSAFKRLTNLQVIWLNDNHLKEIYSETFSGNVNLQRIKLQFNKINFIENNAFNLQGPNNKLKNLDLRGNECIDIETFIFNITEVVKYAKLNCSKILQILKKH
jgi:Leucine-rich repeat (LRR) protein